jgi:hypothetical protein
MLPAFPVVITPPLLEAELLEPLLPLPLDADDDELALDDALELAGALELVDELELPQPAATRAAQPRTTISVLRMKYVPS